MGKYKIIKQIIEGDPVMKISLASTWKYLNPFREGSYKARLLKIAVLIVSLIITIIIVIAVGIYAINPQVNKWHIYLIMFSGFVGSWLAVNFFTACYLIKRKQEFLLEQLES